MTVGIRFNFCIVANKISDRVIEIHVPNNVKNNAYEKKQQTCHQNATVLRLFPLV